MAVALHPPPHQPPQRQNEVGTSTLAGFAVMAPAGTSRRALREDGSDNSGSDDTRPLRKSKRPRNGSHLGSQNAVCRCCCTISWPRCCVVSAAAVVALVAVVLILFNAGYLRTGYVIRPIDPYGDGRLTLSILPSNSSVDQAASCTAPLCSVLQLEAAGSPGLSVYVAYYPASETWMIVSNTNGLVSRAITAGSESSMVTEISFSAAGAPSSASGSDVYTDVNIPLFVPVVS